VTGLADLIAFGGRINMIKGILIVNNYGKPRLVKFYQSVVSLFERHQAVSAYLAFYLCRAVSQTSEDEQQSVIRKVFQQVAQRPDSFCNYLEGSIPEWGDKTKIIYRHYATLYFIFAVDQQESDLGILDLIQVFVEALDKCFENVCELDLIFHSDRVNYILDEIIMAGMVLETNINHILQAVNDQSKMHAASIQTLNAPSASQMSSVASQASDVGMLFSSLTPKF
jgi:AP-3 complex subunit sigma